MPKHRVWEQEGVTTVVTEDAQLVVDGMLQTYVDKARWVRVDAAGTVDAVLIPNGSSRTSVLQVTVGTGGAVQLPVPMPSQISSDAA